MDVGKFDVPFEKNGSHWSPRSGSGSIWCCLWWTLDGRFREWFWSTLFGLDRWTEGWMWLVLIETDTWFSQLRSRLRRWRWIKKSPIKCLDMTWLWGAVG